MVVKVFFKNVNLFLIIFRMSNLFFRLWIKIVEVFLRNISRRVWLVFFLKELKKLIKKMIIFLKFYNIEVINCYVVGYKFKIVF